MFVLSDRPEYLTPSEPETDVDRRILSVWPLLIGKARRWLRAMPDRARVQFDIEDVLQTIWLKLLAEDHHYDASRASYITFACTITGRMLKRLGDKVCRGPRPRPLEAEPGDDGADEPLESIAKAEARQQAAEGIGRAIRRLDDRHHAVVCYAYGIGREPKSVAQMAEWFVESPSRIIGFRTEAEDQVRAALAG